MSGTLCAMRVIGIDEAGYGPLLGPLTAASATLAADGYDPEQVWSKVGRDSGISDSKQVLSHRKMGPGEQTVLTALELLDFVPQTRMELLQGLLLEPPPIRSTRTLFAEEALPCQQARGRIPEACHFDSAQIPLWGDSPPLERVVALGDAFERAGVKLVAVRAVALCPGRLNAAIDAGLTKGHVDFELFAHLLRAEASESSARRLAHIGKIGGRGTYRTLLEGLGKTTTYEEGRARSAYEVEGFGQVEFLRSAESQHLAVALASMVAKLVREHIHDQWHSMLARATAGSLEKCSGYRDPVTKAYVSTTNKTRQRLRIPDACFIRKR